MQRICMYGGGAVCMERLKWCADGEEKNAHCAHINIVSICAREI